METTAISVTSTASRLDLPKREDRKSAMEVMCWLWAMRMSLRSRNHQPTKTSVGPM